MILFKVGLFSSLFYLALTVLLEAALIAATHLFGGIACSLGGGNHPFWNAGLRLAALFGTFWLISFNIAWYIVWQNIKQVLAPISH